MAQKIDYGRRRELSKFTPEKRNEPLYLLMDATSAEIEQSGGYDENGVRRPPMRVKASKCFCPECNTVSDVQASISSSHVTTANGDTPHLELRTYALQYAERSGESLPELPEACPECGHSGAVAMLTRQDADGASTWSTPKMLQERSMSVFEDAAGSPTRVDDTMKLSHTDIQKGSWGRTRIDESLTESALIQEARIVATHIVTEAGKKPQMPSRIDTADPFSYRDNGENMSPAAKYGVRRAENMFFANYTGIGWNRLLHDMSGTKSNGPGRFSWISVDEEGAPSCETSSEYGMIPATGSGQKTPYEEFTEKLDREKLKHIERRFAGKLDPIFADPSKNGLYLAEHHPGSDETNTRLDRGLMCKYGCMMIMYPGAYMLAAEMAQREIDDEIHAQKRKQMENPDYVVKEPSDSAKARKFRSKANRVMEQLCAADDRVLKAIKGIENLEEMKKPLAFFAFGDREAVPKTIRLEKDGTTAGTEYQKTKRMKNEFIRDPIRIAANAYTARKYGITTLDDLAKFNEAASAFSETDKTRVRKNGATFYKDPPKSDGISAGIAAPMRTDCHMRFAKNYAKNHSTANTIQTFVGSCAGVQHGDTTQGFGLYTECLRLYDDILSSGAKIVTDPEETKKVQAQLLKTQVRSYLQQKSIPEAYVDFAEQLGSRTPEIINSLAKEIMRDERLAGAIEAFKEEGREAAVKAYPEIRDKISGKTDEEAQAALDAEFGAGSQIILAPRNGKPLFEDRNLRELHDELSVMAKKCAGTNRPIRYTEKEKQLEREYEAPDGSGTWSFRLMHETHDFIRTATELSNCVGAKSYSDAALAKRNYYLHMDDEMGRKVGCIELKPKTLKDGTKGYQVLQFQGPNDNAITERFAGIAKQWLADNKIDFSSCPDVAKFGTGASIHGAADADYHSDEIDETTGEVVNKNRNKEIQQRRFEAACREYGLNAEGKVNVPAVPDELKDFKI